MKLFGRKVNAFEIIEMLHRRDYADNKEQYRIHCANGYGASVIRGPYTYRGPEGLWEVAVLDKNRDLCYSTPITDDVIGYQTEDEVVALVNQIAELEVQL